MIDQKVYERTDEIFKEPPAEGEEIGEQKKLTNSDLKNKNIL